MADCRPNNCILGKETWTCTFTSNWMHPNPSYDFEFVKYGCEEDVYDRFGFNHWKRVNPIVRSPTCPEGATCYNPEGKCA